VKEVRVYAWRGGVENFGDELGPVVLAKLGYKVTRVEHIHEADMLTAGSLLENAAGNAREGAVIWGSGLLYGEPVDVSRLDVRAVRGTLTARTLGVDVPVGDPGCLVPELWDRSPVVRDLGVVKHYVDEREYSWADAVISADRPVEEVIDFIGSCERIASSSLHGLIVASAWGIPAVRLHHEEVAGGDFKWADWLSGAGDPESLLRALD
jgi:pyruvyltransferase